MMFILFLTLISFSSAAYGSTQKVDTNIKEQKVNQEQAQQSQVKISNTAIKTRSIVDDYRLVLNRIESTKVYNRQLEDFIQSQKEEMVSMKEKIKTLKQTNKDIIPLMVRMVDSFATFVSLDMPFLAEERNRRVKNLQSMMKRADVSTSEKYRRILESYQVENEYGRTIEAYKGPITIDGKDLTVDFFRLGRIGLFYQSLDRKQSGMWDAEKKSWTPMPSEFSRPLRDGLRMARRQQAPNLLKLPIKTPREVSK